MASAKQTVQQRVRQHQLETEPLDYSFRELVSLETLFEVEPRSGRRKARLEEDFHAHTTEGMRKLTGTEATVSGGTSAPMPPSGALPPVCAIRLSNNYLSNLDGFMESLRDVLDEPEELRWIDLSFNQLTDIDVVLSYFPHVRTLYLHGNAIGASDIASDSDAVAPASTAVAAASAAGKNRSSPPARKAGGAARRHPSLACIDKLSLLPNLVSLTLHGNPLAGHPNYKNYVLSSCPGLRHLDFTGVTRADVVAAQRWRAGLKARQAARAARLASDQ